MRQIRQSFLPCAERKSRTKMILRSEETKRALGIRVAEIDENGGEIEIQLTIASSCQSVGSNKAVERIFNRARIAIMQEFAPDGFSSCPNMKVRE